MEREATIAISVENQLRELHGKIWLALNLLKATDCKIIIGQEGQLKNNIDLISPDFLLINGVRWPEKMRVLSKKGCVIASLNEEPILFERDQNYFEKINHTSLYNFVDIILAPGQLQARIIEERAPSRAADVFLTGNPRFDFLQPELRGIYRQESKQLIDKYGKYIIVNTNFVWANRVNNSILHAKMREEPFDIEHICDSSSVEHNLTTDNIQYDVELVERFLSAIKMIAEIGKLDTVVVRPHPSKEDHSFYTKHFASSNEIIVETSGDVRPWILGAQAIIHNGCTTGVEAALMNQPVIAYEPKIDIGNSNRKSIPNYVSETVHTKNELYSSINAILSNTYEKSMSTEQRSQLYERFETLENLAASQIVSVVSEHIDTANHSQPMQYRSKIMRMFQLKIFNYIPMVTNKYAFSKSQKYPGTTHREIFNFISKIQDVQTVPSVSVQNIPPYDEIYLLERNE